jgi:hypothetical protein
MFAIATAGFGVGLAVLFTQGILAPIVFLVSAFGFFAAFGLAFPRVSRLSLLPRFLLLIYAMPFSVLAGYLLLPDYVWTWTPEANAVLSDHIVRQMTTIGLIGLIGLVVGYRGPSLLLPRLRKRRLLELPRTARMRALHGGLFTVLLMVALLFSYASAPAQTILQTAYGGEQLLTLAVAINFPGAFIVSYVLFCVLFIDLQRDTQQARRQRKTVAFFAVLAYVVVFLQLLRGDRESSGLIAAILALYLTAGPLVRRFAESRNASRSRMRRAALMLALIVPIFIGVASVRYTASDPSQPFSAVRALSEGWRHSPWTMILLTNFAATVLYDSEQLEYRLGRTYADYMLSLPPGIVTKALGLERPLEASTNLAVDLVATGLTAGGAHIVLTPFVNFGIFGVLVIMTIYGFTVAVLDIQQQSLGLMRRLIWAALFVTGFLWFWYGEMALIRGVMSAVFVGVLYRLAISLSPARSPVGFPVARSRLSPDGIG